MIPKKPVLGLDPIMDAGFWNKVMRKQDIRGSHGEPNRVTR